MNTTHYTSKNEACHSCMRDHRKSLYPAPQAQTYCSHYLQTQNTCPPLDSQKRKQTFDKVSPLCNGAFINFIICAERKSYRLDILGTIFVVIFNIKYREIEKLRVSINA